MSMPVRSGAPKTINLDVGEDGQCVRFAGYTQWISFRARGQCTLYWTAEDFEADQNGVAFPGDAPTPSFDIEASVINVWLRGPGSEVSVTIVYTTRSF